MSRDEYNELLPTLTDAELDRLGAALARLRDAEETRNLLAAEIEGQLQIFKAAKA